jgi:hypothetical protein
VAVVTVADDVGAVVVLRLLVVVAVVMPEAWAEVGVCAVSTVADSVIIVCVVVVGLPADIVVDGVGCCMCLTAEAMVGMIGCDDEYVSVGDDDEASLVIKNVDCVVAGV